jgi:pyridoxal 5'-phosphate synthase pdxT subunit
MKIGVLALQGDFARHAAVLAGCRAVPTGAASALPLPAIEAVEVRKPAALERVDGLVLPGGESTTLLRLMGAWGFVEALARFHASGRPIFGTCAGVILLARDVDSPRQPSLGLLDVAVERNAYGRQRESFEASGVARLDGAPTTVEMVFIRAPRIRRVGPGVDVLATQGGEPVLVRSGTILGATFHPELTGDPTIHAYFCRLVSEARVAPETV